MKSSNPLKVAAFLFFNSILSTYYAVPHTTVPLDFKNDCFHFKIFT